MSAGMRLRQTADAAHERTVFHSARFERIDEEKRDRILAIAVDEFADNGLAGGNINRIAQKAGISIGSMYQYFATKEDLYLTVVNLGFEHLEKVLEPILESDLSALEKIRKIVEAIFEKTSGEESLTRLYNRFTTEGNSEVARLVATRIETITARSYARLLRQAKAEGAMDADADEKTFAFCMDSIFLVLQFSLSSEYYRDRMKIYLGEEILSKSGDLMEGVFGFIRNGLGGRG